MDWTDVLFLLTLLLYAVASVALLAGYIGRSGRAKGLAAESALLPSACIRCFLP